MEDKKKVVFFDFDGVIADTFDIGFETNRQLYPEVKTEDDFRNKYNGNINDAKKDLCFSKEQIKMMDDEFCELYVPKMARVVAFDGMKDVVRKLAKDYILVIISSTIAGPIKEFLERNEMLSYFEPFEGDKIVHPTKSERIKENFVKYNIDPCDCVFITDTLGDMREAASCGVQAIGVAWGFQRKENLLKGKPFIIVDKPNDLVTATAEYFKKQ